MGGSFLLLKQMYKNKMEKLHRVSFKKSIPCCHCGMDMKLKTRMIFGTSKKEKYYECNTCGHFCK